MANIELYDFSHFQSLSNAGGVGIYVKKNLSYFQRTDINIDIEDCESLFIENFIVLSYFQRTDKED